MAFNSYYPATYQPYYYPQQTYQPQQQSQSGMIWVSGEQEAQSYPVAPNNAVALWDSNGRTIYLKQADASGKPGIRVYDLVERTQAAPERMQTSTGYASKDEVDKLGAAVAALEREMKKLRKKEEPDAE